MQLNRKYFYNGNMSSIQIVHPIAIKIRIRSPWSVQFNYTQMETIY